MNITFIGPPGCGKGTQAALLSRRTGLPSVSTGDLLRDAVARRTHLGIQARSYMDQGLLVPDSIIMGLIEEVLMSPEAQGGILMDGFPRTPAQAEAVDRALGARNARVDAVLRIDVPEDDLVQRLVGRAREQGRSDDTPETIRQRLAVYREQTAPLVAYYEDRGVVLDIPGTGTVEAIAERIGTALGL
jgi:adenylate kinase